jgi:hypothetical protein
LNPSFSALLRFTSVDCAISRDWYWRTFRVPPTLLNSLLGYGPAHGEAE